MDKRAFIKSYGCQMNVYDSARMADALAPLGYGAAYTPEAADPKNQQIAMWIKVLCALTMGACTAAGGWRIIKTLGHKLVKLQPVHGFAAETAGATVLVVTAAMGMPVSTTHVITTAIIGVGTAKRMNALKWSVVERIVWAWILTLPATAGVGYLLLRLMQLAGWVG